MSNRLITKDNPKGIYLHNKVSYKGKYYRVISVGRKYGILAIDNEANEMTFKIPLKDMKFVSSAYSELCDAILHRKD